MDERDEQLAPDQTDRDNEPHKSGLGFMGPLLNYTLSSRCPACAHPTVRRACKVRCERCGFMWDCSEL